MQKNLPLSYHSPFAYFVPCKSYPHDVGLLRRERKQNGPHHAVYPRTAAFYRFILHFLSDYLHLDYNTVLQNKAALLFTNGELYGFCSCLHYYERTPHQLNYPRLLAHGV